MIPNTPRISVIDYNFDWILRDNYLNPRSSPGFLNLEEVISFCSTLDINGLELMHSYWEKFKPSDIKKLADNVGLPIICYIFETDLIVPPASAQISVERVFSLLDRTLEMGASLAMIIPGYVKEEASLKEQRSWLLENLCSCAEHAGSIDITLVAENIDYPPVQPLMGLSSDCADFARQINSDSFRLIFDSAAPVFVDEDPLEALRTMSGFLAHIHLKNVRPVKSNERVERFLDSTEGNRYTGVPLAEGIVDLQAVLSNLHQIEYKGYLSIEYQGETDPREVLNTDITLVRQWYDHID